MPGVLILEQALNGLQFGLMLFLLAAGLTLVFGVMDMINLAHGSLYMVGAFLAAWLVARSPSPSCSAWRSRPACSERCTRATTCRRCSRRSR
jgi:branched-subunit amino acid ABC-type transport system permease component